MKPQSIIFPKEELQKTWSWSGSDYFGSSVMRYVAKLLRKEGIQMAVFKGDGTTNPRSMWDKNPSNYVKVDRYGYGGGKGRRFYSYKITEPKNVYLHFGADYTINDDKNRTIRGKQIKKTFDKLGIPYKWNGNPNKCFTLTINVEENGLVKPKRGKNI